MVGLEAKWHSVPGIVREVVREALYTDQLYRIITDKVAEMVAPQIVKSLGEAVQGRGSEVSPTSERVSETKPRKKTKRQEPKSKQEPPKCHDAAPAPMPLKGSDNPICRGRNMTEDTSEDEEVYRAVPGPSDPQAKHDADKEDWVLVKRKKEKKGDQKEENKGKLTFAGVLASVPQVPRKAEETATYVTVKGSGEGWSPSRIHEQLPSQEELKQIGVSAKMVRVTNGNAVLIRTEGADQAKRLLEWDRLKQGGLEAKLAMARRPRLEVKGVPKHWDEKILVRYLWDKSGLGNAREEDKVEWMRPCFSTPVRGGLSMTWVVEVHQSVRLALMNLSAADMTTGWWSMTIRDYLDPLLCLRCQKYGHPAKACTEDLACKWCLGTGHKIKECPAKKKGLTPRCRNCSEQGREGKDLQHCAGTRECPLHLEKMVVQAKRTRYA